MKPNIVDLAEAHGYAHFKKTGNEYHCPCPRCGGDDRFWLNPSGGIENTGRFACRKCDISGNAIDFGVDYCDLSRNEAREAIGLKTTSGLSVEELSRQKRIPIDVLQGFGLRQGSGEHQLCVVIPYFNSDGSEARPQLRTHDGKQFWGEPKDLPIVPYRLDQLDSDEVCLVEGCSDVWTLKYAGFDALGIPGSSMHGKLKTDHLDGVKRIFIVREDDEGGDTFVKNIGRRLEQIGFVGERYVIDMADLGAADPSDLFCCGPEAFPEIWSNALAEADEECSASFGVGGIAARMIALVDASGADLFHDAEGNAYMSVSENGVLQTYKLGDRTSRVWLARLLWETERRSASSTTIEDAIRTLSGMAMFEGELRTVAVRVAELDGPTIYIDLGDESWQVIEIKPGSWGTVAAEACPIRFTRRAGSLSLPLPESNGPEVFAEFANLLGLDPGDHGYRLLLFWIVQSLRGVGPYPVLEVTGEQGSGKSTMVRFVRALVDPNTAPLRSMPHSDRDAAISCSNGWVQSYDNISHLRPETSDRLCRIATGGGLSTRKLYTDDDEVLFNVCRPILINGINGVAERPDLAERCVAVRLPSIDPAHRKTEKNLWVSFDRMRPAILGALIDAVAQGLKRLPQVDMPELPRMADFGKFAVACETDLGMAQGAFEEAFSHSRRELIEATIESDEVATLILQLVDESSFGGTATELKESLESLTGYGDGKRAPRSWPKSAAVLAKRIKRLAPSLREMGVSVEFNRDSGRSRTKLIHLKQTSSISPSEPSEPSDMLENLAAEAKNDVSRADGSADGNSLADCTPRSADGSTGFLPSEKNGPKGGNKVDSDGADGTDGISEKSLHGVPVKEVATIDGHGDPWDSYPPDGLE